MARLLKILFFPAVFGVLLYLSYQESPQEAAFKHLLERANEENVDVQYDLAVLYQDGTGYLALNEEKAVEWFTKAAKQGHAESQIKLGRAYRYGRGVPEDFEQAVEWYTKAAEQGIYVSQYGLALMYAHGEGTLQDYVKAHAWFNLAAANGFSKGKESRDLIAKEMTSDQLAEAQKMAREMVEANPKVMGD